MRVRGIPHAAWKWGRILPRLFISHSSKDNVEALAFQRWLMANGWAAEDVFIDLHGIGAGERWRDTLRKANASCEAVLLLASPEALDSKECQRELNLAEDLGKEVMVAILRDLKKDDSRLARWADRQFVDLSQQPTERMEPFEHDGKMHRVEFHLPALASIKARLAHLGIAPGSFAWTPREKDTGPFPGLSAFDEDDAGIFFGRDADIMAGITDLRTMRKRRSPRLLVIVAASGAGKSSYLRAGLWPRLMRDPDFAPLGILRPAQGILTGPDGLGRKLAPWFERHGHVKLPGDIHTALAQAGPEAAAALGQLVVEATALATTARRAGAPDARPPAPLIAIDQGEELFASENLAESERFLALLAAVLKDPPPDVDPYVLVTIRADSVEALLQRWPALGLDTPQSRYLPPMSPTAYREVIVKPAEVYAERVRRLTIEPALVEALVRDAQGADALPLLAFTLERLFGEFGADGNLTLARYDAMGGIGGSIDRALAEAQRQAGSGGTLDHLRRLMVPGLATWDPSAGASGAAKRLVAKETELLGGNRASLAPLANALVASRLLTRGSGTLEVAHEALLRRKPISEWLEQQKDALKLRDDVLREASEWTRTQHSTDLVRRGERLTSARKLLAEPDFAGALAPATKYLAACRKHARRGQALMATLVACVVGIGGLAYAGILDQSYLTMQARRVADIYLPTVLTPEQERALKPGDPIKECASCPTLVVVPAGEFVMGSNDNDDEKPPHKVMIKAAFAVGKFEVSFDEWDACVAHGGCTYRPGDNSWGRGRQPIINVSWDDAQFYVKWLSKQTGKTYRLLSEAEWEYAARAGTTTQFSFGDDEATLGDYAWFGKNSDSRAHPVGEKKPNPFGLHDIHGNVWEWVEDAHHKDYVGAPSDGSAWQGDSSSRVLRGGSWSLDPFILRSANRGLNSPGIRDDYIGFRVARTLLSP